MDDSQTLNHQGAGLALLATAQFIIAVDYKVCVCFDVGLNTLVAAIAEQRLTDVAAVGAAIRAGTNCGSCRPAIARLLGTAARKDAHG